ncbi:MAG: hypothetical protein K5695_16305 [Oscillospiraceae bacterium]|nr:hypothetical protein [Oscillospiraceae bacterium]
MKKRYTAVILAAAFLTGCGNTSQMDSLIAAQEATEVPTIAALEADTEAATAPVPSSAFVPSEGDIDLTQLDSNMVYAQVYDMVYNPEAYAGRNVRAKGPFAYYQDEETGKEYFAVLISDATACCAQGIEFVLEKDAVYPDDYPETGTEIIVDGVYNMYEEKGSTYVQLLHAQIEA